jgi:hypothetical protein
MKRDWQIIRQLLQLIEVAPKGDLCFCREYSYLFFEHTILIGEGGFATVSNFDDCALHFVEIDELTDKGRSFLDLSRDKESWDRAMAVADSLGGIDSETLIQLIQLLHYSGSSKSRLTPA